MPEQLLGTPSTAAGVLPVDPINFLCLFRLTLSPAQVAGNTTAEQTFTANGLPAGTTGSVVLVSKPTAQAGLGIVGARISAANTVAITFSNNTAGAITPTALEVYSFLVLG